MRKAITVAVLVLVLSAMGGTVAAQVAWTFRRIAVPAYGYFAKHRHCKTEDMVLVQRDYPNSVEWTCRHIDNL